jgi:hypothetical protein
MRTGWIISERKETPSTPKTLLKIGYSITLKYLYNMSLFETFGRIFSPTGELTETKPTHRLCRYCDCFHEEIGEFCSEVCEQGYKWEYEQEFYTSQNREQETEQLQNGN